MDRAFWEVYYPEVCRAFPGLRVCARLLPSRYRVVSMKRTGFRPYNNSGAGAVSLARFMGAARILMLGFDQAHTGGRAHHHADHPRSLRNATPYAISRWSEGFAALRARLDKSGIEYVNCSRETRLDWPRKPLEQVIDAWRAA